MPDGLGRVAVAAGLTLAALSGCGGTQPASPVQVDEWTADTPAGALTQLGVCVDGSASVNPATVTAGVDAVASAIRAVAPPSKTAAGPGGTATELADATDGLPATDGLRLLARRVSASSYGSVEDILVDGMLQPLPGLRPQPAVGDYATYPQRMSRWEPARDRAEQDRAEVDRQRVALLDQLARTDFAGSGSEIGGCITALRDDFSPHDRVVIVVLSDLDQVGEPQLGGDYHHVELVVVPDCTEFAVCEERRAQWQAVFDELGVKTAEFTSIGRLADVLTERLRPLGGEQPATTTSTPEGHR